MAKVPDISPEELQPLLQGPNPPVLLDVREPDEWLRCRIDGARHLSMKEIKDRLAELDPNPATVVYCHHGGRSRKVADFLQQQGFAQVANLDGGIDAWSRRVDPSVPRY